MSLDQFLIQTLPRPEVVRGRMSDLLREMELLRGLLRLSEKAAEYRECDEEQQQDELHVPASRVQKSSPLSSASPAKDLAKA